MGTLRNTFIAEQRVYANPQNPAQSVYDRVLPVTVPAAVVDPATGQNLAQSMGGIQTDNITLTNDEQYPFNNSEVTVPLTVTRQNTDYGVYIISATANNSARSQIGLLTVFDKLLNGFKLAYTGSATSVTVRYRVEGGMN